MMTWTHESKVFPKGHARHTQSRQAFRGLRRQRTHTESRKTMVGSGCRRAGLPAIERGLLPTSYATVAALLHESSGSDRA